MTKPKLTIVTQKKLTRADQLNAEKNIAELIERSERRKRELKDAWMPSMEGNYTEAALLALMDVAQNWSKKWRHGKPVDPSTFDDFEKEL